MIRSVLGSRASIGGPLGSGRGGAAAAWYLAGGVSAANCVAAYQPKGAVSLAASYTNLANPGTYDAAPGVAPTWAAATGWAFAAANSQYLTTGVVPGNTISGIIRFSDLTNTGALFGMYEVSTGFTIFGERAANSVRYYHANTSWDRSPKLANGVLAMTASGGTSGQGYRNGSADGAAQVLTGWTNPAMAVFIGARNNIGAPGDYATVKIQAVAIYNTTLTAPQVAAVSAAMSLL